MGIQDKILENKNTLRGGLSIVIFILLAIIANWMGDNMDTSSYTIVILAGIAASVNIIINALVYIDEIKQPRYAA